MWLTFSHFLFFVGPFLNDVFKSKPADTILSSLLVCDGVLLDWENSFHDWMAKQGHVRNASVKGMYDMENMYGIPPATVVDLIEDFNTSAYIYDLPALRDARSGVATLVEAGYKFVCITSINTSQYTYALRKMNLENMFGKDVFSQIITLGTNVSKKSTLKAYADVDNYWWIEDKWENAVDGADVGLRSIIIDHSYNRYEDARIPRAHNWKDICKLIIGE